MDTNDGSGEGNEKLVSDSGYSNSRCNSNNSQKSNSATSRHCGSDSSGSSGSSGYGGQITSPSSKEDKSAPKRNKDKISTAQCATSPNSDSDSNPLIGQDLDPKQKSLQLTLLNDVSKVQMADILDTMDLDLPSSSLRDHDTLVKNSHIDHLSCQANAKILSEKQPGIATNQIVHGMTMYDGPTMPKTSGNDTITCTSGENNFGPFFTVTSTDKQGSTTYRWSAVPKPVSNGRLDRQIDDFNCVVSMHDGIIMYVTSLETTTLGYPKDMWVGRSFMDFVHPKDQSYLMSEIVSGVGQPLFYSNDRSKDTYRSTVFCRFRRYRTLQSGCTFKKKTTLYDAFILSITFKNILEADIKSMYLIIHAKPIVPAYSASSKILGSPTRFMTQHTSLGKLSHVDDEATTFWGYLPQDIMNKLVFEFYHPDDLLYLKQVYETVLTTGCKFKSKPYRFLAQNGDYVVMDTDWSSFVNPWTTKLEFIVGHHRVISGPKNSNIFKESGKDWKNSFSVDAINRSKEIYKQNIDLMNENFKKPCHPPSHDKSHHQVTAFMEALVYECSRVDQELKINIPFEDPSLSERASIMFGEISPHHDYYDSKSSTETPPSYNQLNYSDNLQRFFESKPSTAIQEYIPEPETTSDMDSKTSPLNQHEARKCISPIQHDSGGSRGSGSSAGSNAQISLPEYNSAKTNKIEDDHISDNSQFPNLTESILIKHNTEMEKKMFKKHKDARSVLKAGEREKQIERRERNKDFITRYSAALMKKQCGQTSIGIEKQNLLTHNNGIKRRSSQIRNTNEIKIAKYATTKPTPKLEDKKNYGLQNDQNMGSHSNVYHSVKNVGLQQCSYTLAALPQLQSMETVTTPIPSIPSYGHVPPCVVYPDGAQSNSYTPVTTMACQLWGNGCVPALPVTESGLYCLTQSNFRQALQQNVTQEDETDPEINYKNSSKIIKDLRKDAEDVEESSNFSYFYSSFCKTENGSYDDKSESANRTGPSSSDARRSRADATSSSSNNEINSAIESNYKFDTFEQTKLQIPVRKLEPPWLDQVVFSSELIYRYQVETKSIKEALEADMIALKGTSQPVTVDDQLSQLYSDLQLEGFPSKLTFEEGITSSSSSGEMQNSSSKTPKASKREYSQLMMLFEEEAPLPSPLKDSEDEL